MFKWWVINIQSVLWKIGEGSFFYIEYLSIINTVNNELRLHEVNLMELSHYRRDISYLLHNVTVTRDFFSSDITIWLANNSKCLFSITQCLGKWTLTCLSGAWMLLSHGAHLTKLSHTVGKKTVQTHNTTKSPIYFTAFSSRLHFFALLITYLFTHDVYSRQLESRNWDVTRDERFL